MSGFCQDRILPVSIITCRESMRLIKLFRRPVTYHKRLPPVEQVPRSVVGVERLLDKMNEPGVRKVLEQGMELHIEEGGGFGAQLTGKVMNSGEAGAELKSGNGFRIDLLINPKSQIGTVELD